MQFAALLLTIMVAGVASAKLPAATDEAAAKAAEAAAKSAWSDKVGAYQTCRADERVAEAYRRNLKSTGKEVPIPTPTAPCTDPGPYASVATPAKPLEASGAHSPAETATGPPGSPLTKRELSGGKSR